MERIVQELYRSWNEVSLRGTAMSTALRARPRGDADRAERGSQTRLFRAFWPVHPPHCQEPSIHVQGTVCPTREAHTLFINLSSMAGRVSNSVGTSSVGIVFVSSIGLCPSTS